MRIAIGIPIVRSVSGDVYPSHLSLMATLGRMGEVVTLAPLDVYPHDRARQFIADNAVAANCDYLLFVDSDMLVPSDAPIKLLETLQKQKAQVVSGYTPRRGYPYTNSWFETNHLGLHQIEPFGNEVREIQSSGLACTMIDLRWLQKFKKPWFFQGCLEPNDPKSFVWEDAYFCNLVRDNSGKIFGDARVECGHQSAPVIVTRQNADRLRAEYLQAEPPKSET